MGKKVLIIGGGLGGVSAAIHLKTAGYDVELHEKNDHVGGKLNLKEKDGFSFDLGPSILTLPQIFEDVFAAAGRTMSDYLQIVEPERHWRCFYEDGDRIDLLRDPAMMEEANPSLNAGDLADLDSFLQYSKGLYENVEEGYFSKGLDTLIESLKFYRIRKSLLGLDIFSTMHRGVVRHIRNTNLAHAMDFFVKYVGSSPYDAPAVLNMIPYAQFRFGLWYVRGGMYNLARALQKLMDELGIEIHLGSEITELVRDGNRIRAARTCRGEELPCDIFVSNMETVPAYSRLTGESESFLRKYDKFEPACSGLVIHLGVRRIYEQLAHHNFFFSRDPEKHFSDVFRKHRLPQDPTIYLVAPSRTDPAVAPEGCDNIKILPHIPYIQDNPFSDDDYLQLKERVLDKLERMGLEGLRENTFVEDMWTPEDIRTRYYSNRGAIYGVVSHKKKNLGFKTPKKSRKYDNLYFVGGSVNPGGGMPMVVLSGRQTARMIGEQHDA